MTTSPAGVAADQARPRSGCGSDRVKVGLPGPEEQVNHSSVQIAHPEVFAARWQLPAPPHHSIHIEFRAVVKHIRWGYVVFVSLLYQHIELTPRARVPAANHVGQIVFRLTPWTGTAQFLGLDPYAEPPLLVEPPLPLPVRPVARLLPPSELADLQFRGGGETVCDVEEKVLGDGLLLEVDTKARPTGQPTMHPRAPIQQDVGEKVELRRSLVCGDVGVHCQSIPAVHTAAQQPALRCTDPCAEPYAARRVLPR